MTGPRRPASPHHQAFDLDPSVAFLNHGSFGACPRAVTRARAQRLARLESQPVRYYVRELLDEQDRARETLAAFVGADPQDLVFVTNATAGVNTILASRRLEPGDELLVTDHGYNACRNALEALAARTGARVVVAALPFPVAHADELVAPILEAVGPRTRLALLDHVTSPTGLVLPLERLVGPLREAGVFVLVDGAHAPGMLDLDLEALGADAYTGNAHKWLCSPKSAALLHVRREHQPDVRPLVISHGANAELADRSRFLAEFDWQGTDDPTPRLGVPDGIATMGALLDGGWPALRRHNHALVLAGRDRLCQALGCEAPTPDDLLGSLAAVVLPPAPPREGPRPLLGQDPLQDRLWREQRIEVPIFSWPSPERRLLRVSAQAYNHEDEYAELAALLPGLLEDEARGAGG